jgi:D-beta-D-heptose 7-phosphate kinase/D-beta-D-heptose 1-phosphate adenosyltransferase
LSLPSPRILVVGDLLLDTYLEGECDRISPEAPIPVVVISNQKHRLGGAGNVASNLRALGCDVELISVVGADAAAERLRELMDAEGIASTSLVVDCSRPSSEKTRVVVSNQQVFRFDQEWMYILDRATGEIVFDAPVTDDSAAAVTVGPDGSVYVAILALLHSFAVDTRPVGGVICFAPGPAN